jgi:hypothetical protein
VDVAGGCRARLSLQVCGIRLHTDDQQRRYDAPFGAPTSMTRGDIP